MSIKLIDCYDYNTSIRKCQKTIIHIMGCEIGLISFFKDLKRVIKEYLE